MFHLKLIYLWKAYEVLNNKMKYNVGKKIQGKVRESCETTLKVLF